MINAGFTFGINVSDMLYSTTLTNEDTILVNSITLASNSQHDSVQTGKLSITIGDKTYVSGDGTEDRTGGGYGTITYNFSGEDVFALGVSDTLTASIIDTTKVSIGVFKGQSGMEGITSPTGYGAWQAAVKITGTKAIPEPTTATLSLLAPAGLAARRRRK